MLKRALKLVENIDFNQYKYITINEVIKRLDNEELDTIIKDKILVYDEGTRLDKEYLKYFMINNKFKPNNIYINLTGKCNSNCIYCFGEDYMSCDKKVDFKSLEETLNQVMRNTSDQLVVINFFGGEPLLEFDLMKQIVKFLNENFKELNIKYAITTNGINLDDEKIKFIKENLEKVTISIDGNQEHMLVNRNVEYIKSQELYSKIRKLNENYDKVALRVTMTKFNMEIKEIYNFFKELGIKKMRFQPVSCKGDEDFAIENWDYLNKQIGALMDEYSEDFVKNLIRIRPFDKVIEQIENKRLKFFGCSLGMLSIDEQQDFYPCFRMCGTTEFKLKNLEDHNIHNKLVLNFVDNKESCNSCWCKYICGGGCYADSTIYNNEISKTYTSHCNFQKSLIKNSILLYKKLLEKGAIVNE